MAPRVLEDLTENERYLYALLQDQSGVDIAEFLWIDETSADNVYRCWDYQIPWYRCREKFQIDQCARSIGKSEGIQMRAFAFAFTDPGEQLLITAPEQIHLDPTTEKIERRLLNSRVTREMLKRSNSSNGIRHKPFEVQFVNGASIICRIPQKDGKGVKGMHPKRLELDEAQDFPEPGWVELGETLKFENKDSTWRAHGVSKGVHDRYYKATQDPNWWVHRYTAMHKPDWSAAEREAKIEYYGGSRTHPDYRRNILGLHGDLTNPLFVLHRLMQCVDINDASTYNQHEYYITEINDLRLQDSGVPIDLLLDFPMGHKSYRKFWVGMDVGMTNAPSVILIFGEEAVKGPQGEFMRLKLLTKITLSQIRARDQRAVLSAINTFYQPEAICLDGTGIGLPLFQEVIDGDDRALASVTKSYNFSGHIIVGWDSSDPDFFYDPSDPENGAIKAPVLEYSTDMLRKVVDERAFWMPHDKEIIREFSGTTYVQVRQATAQNPYGKKIFSKNGGLHTLDAARMAVLGWRQQDIDAILKQVEEYEPVCDYFLPV